MNIIKIGTHKYFVDSSFETKLKDFLDTHKKEVVLLSNNSTLESVNNVIGDKTKLSDIINSLKRQQELSDDLLDCLFIAMKRDSKALANALFSIEKPQNTNDIIQSIQIPNILLETANLTQYGRTGVVGRGEITLSLILKNDTVLEPGGKYDIKIDDEYWHVKDATKTGINAATISTMGKRLLWDTDKWPFNMLKKAGLDVMKLSTETIRQIADKIAKQYVRMYGSSLLCDDGNIKIAELFQNDLDTAFRESKVWGEAVGLIILENDKFYFVNKNQTYFGTMSGTGEPEFSLRKNRYKNALIQELDINWPYEKDDIEFQQEFEV